MQTNLGYLLNFSTVKLKPQVKTESKFPPKNTVRKIIAVSKVGVLLRFLYYCVKESMILRLCYLSSRRKSNMVASTSLPRTDIREDCLLRTVVPVMTANTPVRCKIRRQRLDFSWNVCIQLDVCSDITGSNLGRLCLL